MKPPIRAVVFDYGNVLALHDRREICRRLSAHSALSAEEILPLIYGNDLEFESETGKFDSREHFRRIKERIGGDDRWSYDEFAEEFKNVFVLNEEAVGALELAARSHRVFILSNTTYLHALWLFEQEILATVPELYFLSFKLGVMKPDPEIFRIMMRTGALTAEECLYVDDLPEFCDAAGALGIHTIHYRRGATDLCGEITRRSPAQSVR